MNFSPRDSSFQWNQELLQTQHSVIKRLTDNQVKVLPLLLEEKWHLSWMDSTTRRLSLPVLIRRTVSVQICESSYVLKNHDRIICLTMFYTVMKRTAITYTWESKIQTNENLCLSHRIDAQHRELTCSCPGKWVVEGWSQKPGISRRKLLYTGMDKQQWFLLYVIGVVYSISCDKA